MRIRPLELDDVTQVASLWQYWFRGRSRTPDPGLEDLVRRIYFESPCSDPDVRPLVADDGHGKVLAFLGVTTTPVMVDGQQRTLAAAFPPIREPDAPRTIVSFLLRRLLTGPQALTFSDGGHVLYEPIWQRLGGHVAPTASLRWLKLLRPSRSAGEVFLANQATGGTLAPLWRPLTAGMDWIARRSWPGHFGTETTSYTGERASPEALADFLTSLHEHHHLWPRYTAERLAWQFAEMARIRDQGSFEVSLVRAPDGELVGWWAAYLNPSHISRVFAVDAPDAHLEGVVDHLFRHAEEARAGALIGRLEPRLRRPMARRGTFTHNGGSLVLVHGRDRQLVDDVLLGRVPIGRLEGENWYWWAIVSHQVPTTDDTTTS